MAPDRFYHGVLRFFRWRVRCEGAEHVPESGAFLLVGNHQSYIDPPLLGIALSALRHRKIWFLTKEYVWRGFSKFGGRRLLRLLGMLPILTDRKADSLQAAIDVLRSGGIVAIFPEGTRNIARKNPDWTTTLLQGRTGAARLALATGAPVIPAGIIAPTGVGRLEAIRNFFSAKQPAVVRFGPAMHIDPVPQENMTKPLLTDLTRRIMNEVGSLCGKQYHF